MRLVKLEEKGLLDVRITSLFNGELGLKKKHGLFLYSIDLVVDTLNGLSNRLV